MKIERKKVKIGILKQEIDGKTEKVHMIESKNEKLNSKY